MKNDRRIIRCRCHRVLSALLLVLLPISVLSQSTPVGGLVTNNTIWSPAMGTILVYSNVIVTNGAALRIEAGTTVRLTNNLSISALSGCTIDVEGTESQPVLFLPMVGNNKWGNLSVTGNNSFLTNRHAELAYGGINLANQATALIEDCYVHDVVSAIVGNSAKFVTVRRVHVNNFSETIFNSGTVVLAEDSLYENVNAASGDCFEIQNGPPGSIIRRCTFRHGTQNNTDAIDFNGSTNVLVQDCLVYDFNDKGISMGTAVSATDPPARGIVVSNCLVYSAGTGAAVKDFSTASLYNNTFVDSAYGVRLYEKYSPYNASTGGGRFTNGYNNIIWNNTTVFNTLSNGSVLSLTFSDLQNTNLPGAGNISSNPLFVNSAQRDYRLSTNSPALTNGYLGQMMGVHFPVGAPMALSHPRFESVVRSETNVVLSFWADSEKTYTLQTIDSLANGTWSKLTNLTTRPLPILIRLTNDLSSSESRFYRLTTP